MIRTLLLATTLLAATPALADPITYTFSGLLSGTLNGNAFDLAPVSFTLESDTDLVFQPAPFDLDLFNTPASTLHFTIGGVSGDFDPLFNAFSNTVAGNGLVGFTEQGESDIFDVNDDSLIGYDLRSSIGPVGNQPVDFLNFGTLFGTSAGDLIFDNDDGASLTFQAVLADATVPEPGTWAMMILGFGAVAASARYHRRSVQVAFA